jgi:hypothetical protein
MHDSSNPAASPRFVNIPLVSIFAGYYNVMQGEKNRWYKIPKVQCRMAFLLGPAYQRSPLLGE